MACGLCLKLSVVGLWLWCSTLLPSSEGTVFEDSLKALIKRSEEYKRELLEFAALPTVSSLAEHATDVEAGADWLVDRLKRAGMQNARKLNTTRQPIVYADFLHAGNSRPTVLLYAHYDVQPADPIELWETPPFKPVLDEASQVFRGRGVSDDKQGVLAVIHALEVVLEAGGSKLPVNVKVLFEGQEELLSPDLQAFLEANAQLFTCDYAFSADGGQIAEDVPGIQIGMRGQVAAALGVRTAATDMHSGTYGGSVQNAKHALAELLASFHTRDGRVAVEGFYEGVADPTELDASDIAAFPLDEEAERAELSTYEPVGEPGFSTLERRWLRPTLEVVGMWGGFTGEGLKTVLPAEAHAKLSCRLVPGQTPSDILRKLGRHVERFRPKGCSVDLQPLGGESMAYSLPRDSHAVRMAATALQRATGRSPLLYKAGSTIPAMELLQRFLGVHPVPFGFTLHSFDRLHSPNERFKVSMFELAHRAYVELLFTVAEQHTQHREEL